MNKKIQDDIKKMRKDIPEEYNQAELLDYLTDDDKALFVSISNRADGKSFNYIGILLKLAVKYKSVRPMFVVRHFQLRNSMVNTIDTIADVMGFKPGDISFVNGPKGIRVFYKNRENIAYITDLKSASDLKLESAAVEKFKLLVYDEFIALPDEYEPLEYEYIRTMLETVNRNFGANPDFKSPKILLLGNALNFDSPLMERWNLVNLYSNMKFNEPMITGYKVLEYRFNKNSKKKNSTPLIDDDDGNTTSMFMYNNFMVVNPDEKVNYPYKISIKVDDYFKIRIWYNEALEYYLDVTTQSDNDIKYCLRLADVNEHVELLTDEDYDEFFHQKFEKNKIKFGNAYSISFFDRNTNLKDFNYKRLLKHKANVTITDKVIEDRNLLEDKAKIYRKVWPYDYEN